MITVIKIPTLLSENKIKISSTYSESESSRGQILITIKALGVSWIRSYKYLGMMALDVV